MMDRHVVTAIEPAWVEQEHMPDSRGIARPVSEPQVGDAIESLQSESTYECTCGASLASWQVVEEHFAEVMDVMPDE